jgi:hypothetical protein
LQKVEGNWGWCFYRVGREEFRIPEFEKIFEELGVILLMLMEVSAPEKKHTYFMVLL